MIFKKIYSKLNQLSEYLIYSVPSLILKDDMFLYILKASKEIDLNQIIINQMEVPEQLKEFPMFVQYYITAVVRDIRRKETKEFLIENHYNITVHSKENEYFLLNKPILTIGSVCDIEIDKFKRINFDFNKLLKKKKRNNKKLVKLKGPLFLKHNNFYKNYIEFNKNLNVYKKFDYERVLISYIEAEMYSNFYNKQKYSKYSKFPEFEVRKEEFASQLNLFRIKQERSELAKFFRFKRHLKLLLRYMIDVSDIKILPYENKIYNDIKTLRVKNCFEEILDVKTVEIQLENTKNLDDGYSYETHMEISKSDSLFKKYFNLPKQFININKNKTTLAKSLTLLTCLNFYKKINFYFLDISLVNGIYEIQKMIKLFPNIKDFIKFYKLNFYNDFYKKLIYFNKFFSIEKTNLFNDLISTLNHKNLYTYVIPSHYNMKEIIDLSKQEKFLLLEQLKFFKQTKFLGRRFYGNPFAYYKTSKNFFSECFNENSNFQTYFSSKSFFFKIIKYVSLLNYIYCLKNNIRPFFEKIFVYKELFKKIYWNTFKLYFNNIIGVDINIFKNVRVYFPKTFFLNIKIFLSFCLNLLKKFLINIYILPRLIFFFFIKSLFYILILILQFFVPFSYIMVDIFIYVFKKLFFRNKISFDFYNLFKFKGDFLTFIRPFKNKLEYNFSNRSLFKFKSYKNLNVLLYLRNNITINFLRQLYTLNTDKTIINIFEFFKKRGIEINNRELNNDKLYENYYYSYNSKLKDDIKVSLTNNDVQVFIKTTSTKIHLGEFYIPNNIPCLEVIKTKLVYEDLNFMEKLFYNLSRTAFYNKLFSFLNTSTDINIIKYFKIFLNKAFLLFFINRVEFKEYGIEFFNYSLTTDSVFALQEYLILISNYKNTKKFYSLFTIFLKRAFKVRESYNNFLEYVKNYFRLITYFFSNSEYRYFLNRLIVEKSYALYFLSKVFFYEAKESILTSFVSFYEFTINFGWLFFLYRETRLVLFLIIQGYYTSPSRPFIKMDSPLDSSLFGIRTVVEVYKDIIEAVFFTYLLRGGLRFDIFVENHPVLVSYVVWLYNLIIYLISPKTLANFFSCYFLVKFIYEKILFYFFYLSLENRISITEKFDFICKSKDKIAIEFAKYVQYNHERIITFNRWFTWVHFDKPKIYYKKFMLVILNYLLVLTRNFLFPEIYGITLVILERINKLSKVIIIFSNILNKLDNWAWNFFDFINKVLYVKLPFNLVYHLQCYTIEYRGILKLFFYTPFYIIIIFLQLFFIFINIVILLFPLIIVLLDTLIEMYYNYLKELLNLSPFATSKEHFDKYYSPRFNNIYRSHRNRLSESLTFKNDLIVFVNQRRDLLTSYKQKNKYFPDFYSKKRDLVYKCDNKLGYKRDKQILRLNFIRNKFNLNKAFIGNLYRFHITPEWFEQKHYEKLIYEKHNFSRLFPTSRFHPRILGQYGSKFNRPTTSSPLELPNRYNHFYIITNEIPRSLYHYVPNYWFDREIDDMIDDDFESSSIDLFDTMEPNEERYISLAYKRNICASGFYESMEMEEQTFWSEYTFIMLYRSVHNFLIKKETESIKDLMSTDRIFDFYYNEVDGRYYDTYGNEVMIEKFELKYNVSDYFDWRFPEDLEDVTCGVIYDYNEENRYFDVKWNILKVKINTIYSYSDDINKKILITNNLLTYLELKKIPNYNDPMILKEFDSLRQQFNFTLALEYYNHEKEKRIDHIKERKRVLYHEKRLEVLKIFDKKNEQLKKELKAERYIRIEEINKRYSELEKELDKQLDAIHNDPALKYTDEENVEMETILKEFERTFRLDLKKIGIDCQTNKDLIVSKILTVRHNLRINLEHKVKRIIEKITCLQKDYLNLIDIKRKNNFMTSESAIKKIYKEEDEFRRKLAKERKKNKEALTLKDMRPLNNESISLIKNYSANMFKLEFNKNISELRSQLNMAKFQLKNLECDILLDGLVYKYGHIVETLKNLRFIKKNNLFKSEKQESAAVDLVKNLNLKINKDKLRLAKKINSIKKVRTYNFLYKDFNLWFSGFSYYHLIYVSCLDNGVFTWPYGHIQVGALEDWGNWYFRYAFYLGYESFHMPDGEYYEHEEDEDDEDEDVEETEDFDDETDGDCDPWYIDGWDMDEQIDTEDILGWLHQCFYEDDIEKGGFKIRDNNKKFFYKETNRLYYIDFIINLKKAAKTLKEDTNRAFEELNYYERLVLKEGLSTEDGVLKVACLKNKTEEEQNIEIKKILDISKVYISSRRTFNFRVLNKLYRQAIYKIDDFRRTDKVYIPKGYWDREKDKEKYKEYARNRKLQLDMAYKKGEIMLHRLSFIHLRNAALVRPKIHYFVDLYYHEYYIMYRIYRRKLLTYTESFIMKPFIKLLKILLEQYPNDHDKVYEDVFKFIELVYETKVYARNCQRFYVTIIEKRSSENLFILDPEEVKAEAEYVKNRDEGKYLF